MQPSSSSPTRCNQANTSKPSSAALPVHRWHSPSTSANAVVATTHTQTMEHTKEMPPANCGASPSTVLMKRTAANFAHGSPVPYTIPQTLSLPSSPHAEFHFAAGIFHEGVSPGGGHYCSFRREHHAWVYTNDAVSFEVSFDQIEADAPYLLFYSASAWTISASRRHTKIRFLSLFSSVLVL